MNNQEFKNASWDDMVFEGLNKDYGAFVLRQLVNKNTQRALIATFSVFLLLIGLSQLKVFKNLGKKKEKEEEEAPPP